MSWPPCLPFAPFHSTSRPLLVLSALAACSLDLDTSDAEPWVDPDECQIDDRGYDDCPRSTVCNRDEMVCEPVEVLPACPSSPDGLVEEIVPEGLPFIYAEEGEADAIFLLRAQELVRVTSTASWATETVVAWDDVLAGTTYPVTADVDADGDRDIVLANSDSLFEDGTTGLWFLRREGDQFTPPEQIRTDKAWTPRVVDLDADGVAELLWIESPDVAGAHSIMRWLPLDGASTVAIQLEIESGHFPVAIGGISDWDRDGRDEFVARLRRCPGTRCYSQDVLYGLDPNRAIPHRVGQPHTNALNWGLHIPAETEEGANVGSFVLTEEHWVFFPGHLGTVPDSMWVDDVLAVSALNDPSGATASPDLDGDGVTELVVSSRSGLLILRRSEGALDVCYQYVSTEVGPRAGFLHVADLDDDGDDELVMSFAPYDTLEAGRRQIVDLD